MVETKLSACVEVHLASRCVVANVHDVLCAMPINAKKLPRFVFNKESMEWLWLWRKIWDDVPKRINYALVAPFAIDIRLTNAWHIFVVHVYCYSTPKKIYILLNLIGPLFNMHFISQTGFRFMGGSFDWRPPKTLADRTLRETRACLSTETQWSIFAAHVHMHNPDVNTISNISESWIKRKETPKLRKMVDSIRVLCAKCRLAEIWYSLAGIVGLDVTIAHHARKFNFDEILQ